MLNKYDLFRGKNCIEKFVENLVKDCIFLFNNYLNKKNPINITKYDEIHFQNTNVCHICNKEIEKDNKVLDHDHIFYNESGSNYRGPACNSCNLNYITPKFIPVLFHNFSNYDCHLLIKELMKNRDNLVTIIPKTDENYISVSLKIHKKYIDSYNFSDKNFHPLEVRFLDSYKFLSSSLAVLTENLTDTDFKDLESFFPTKIEHLHLIRRKQFFPYDFINCWEKYDQETLPTREKFFNSLKNEEISQENYSHAKNIFEKFECKNLGEYSDLYLLLDTALLQIVIEQFRNISMKIYDLDPLYFFTLPGLSFSAALKYTKVEIELLDDIEMYQFFNSGIRGGICQSTIKNIKANHEFLENYNPSIEKNYPIMLDVNNQYGKVLQGNLPLNNFRFLDSASIENFDLNGAENDQNTGYVLEVDIDYPNEIHDKHNFFPFLPKNEKIPNSNDTKLLLTLENKTKYIIHIKNLCLAIQSGLKLKKIHRILAFHHCPWLKPYIEINTHLRSIAKSKFEQDFYKLMVNSIFGKTIENKMNRRKIYLVKTWNDYSIARKNNAQKLIANPFFKAITIFDETFAAMELNESQVVLNSPISVGFCVLELSKYLMYYF
jgi:hypothetical protein